MVKALEKAERKGASQASISESQYIASNTGGGDISKQIAVYKQMIFQRDEVINGLNDKLA
jgi:hypothetical protein